MWAAKPCTRELLSWLTERCSRKDRHTREDVHSWLLARCTVLFSDESRCPDSVLRDYPVNMKEPRRKQTISAGGWLPCGGVTWAPSLSAACQSGERGGWRSFTPQRKSGCSAAHLLVGEGGGNGFAQSSSTVVSLAWKATWSTRTSPPGRRIGMDNGAFNG